MTHPITRLLAVAFIAAAVVACGKSISVKEDAMNYQAAEMKIQTELATKQQALMQKAQALQQNPEKIDELLPEVNQFVAEAKAKLLEIKPQTKKKKKFQAQEIKSIEEMVPLMNSLVEAVKSKDLTKIQAAQQVYFKAMQDLQAAKAELMKQAEK